MRTTIACLTTLALLLSLTACTAAQRSTAGSVVADVGSAAPVACAVLSATGANVGTACAPVAQDVSDVTKLVSDILASLPAPSATKALTIASGSAMVAIRVKAPSGALVDVTLPAALAAQVQSRLH